MPFDVSTWTGDAARTEDMLAAARAELEAAELAWVAAHERGEDPFGARPPASRHPLRIAAQERFRRAHAKLVALRDELEEVDLDIVGG